MIYGQVQAQAMMLSLNDIYRLLCYLMAVAIIVTVFMPRTRAHAGAAAAHWRGYRRLLPLGNWPRSLRLLALR